jgi:hypothetical protein
MEEAMCSYQSNTQCVAVDFAVAAFSLISGPHGQDRASAGMCAIGGSKRDAKK